MHFALLLLSGTLPSAWSGPLPEAETFLSTYPTEPPNILFVLDLSGSLEEEADCDGDASTPAATCFTELQTALGEVVARTSWAYFGVVGTTPDPAQSWYTPVAPLGASHADVAAAIEQVTATYSGARNLAEVLADVARGYLSAPHPSGALYAAPTFGEGPICQGCQETHVVVLTGGRPSHDRHPVAPIPGSAALGWDVLCDTAGREGASPDTGCLYDNIAHLLYRRDHRLDLPGPQAVITHTISINLDNNDDQDSTARLLFWSAAHKTTYRGWYWEATGAEGIRRALAEVMEDIRSPISGLSAPTLKASGAQVLYAYTETTAYRPLAQGHLRSFSLGIDPEDPGTFGQVVYDDASPVGGARWDAGERLSRRPVSWRETNEDDRDGAGRRDIYTFLPELAALSTGDPVVQAARAEGRFAFDRTLVDLAATSPEVLSLFLPAGAVGPAHPWDLDGDAQVDAADLQRLVDFARGVEGAPFRYLDWPRGSWRLGDSPRAVPALLWSRPRSYGVDPAYRLFLSALERSDAPDVALLAANDGMLHAFDLDSGEELWAWVPARLLYQTRSPAHEGRLVDLLWSGRPHLFEGSPVVEDVWVDADGDGSRQCVSVPDDCEWRRVVVVSQGRGGPAVLALDVTDPTAPRFLWEQVDPDHADATGHGPRRPGIVSLRDGDRDRWTALWGTGHARLPQESPRWAAQAEPALYLRALADHYAALPQATYAAQATTGRFSAGGLVHHPSPSALDTDGDGRPEGGALPGTPAAVDLNDDGTVDILYLHLTDSSSADGLPRTHLYKVLLNSADPEASRWCPLYDASAAVGTALESFYSPTVSWMEDGSLGIYWGTGTPYDGHTRAPGHLFGVRDLEPAGCRSPEPLCGTDGSLPLGEGTRLTDDPLIYNGVVYAATWTPDPAGCGEGIGHIYGLRFDTCQAAMPDPEDAQERVASVSVSTYPSTITLSDQGTLLYPHGPLSLTPILALDTRDPLQGTALLSHALLPY